MTTQTSASGDRRSALLIGLAPEAVDYTRFPGLDAATLAAGLQAALDAVLAAGVDASWCLTDRDPAAAEAAIAARLAERSYDAVMIGAGVRAVPENLALFERILNLVHAAAPGARICFNTSPDTTLAAIRRWLPPAA